MADNQRIEDLRRRVQKDPASIAFAQLAEECRRAGFHQEAVNVCRAGLHLHPGYLSARVTLGRALIELNDLDVALAELELVLKSAPENLAAIRGLAEIYHRQGSLAQALAQYRAALALARNDPDLQRTVAELARQVEPPLPPASADGLSFEQMQSEFLMHLPPPPTPAPPPATPAVAAQDAPKQVPAEPDVPPPAAEMEAAAPQPAPTPPPPAAEMLAAEPPFAPLSPPPAAVIQAAPAPIEHVDAVEPAEKIAARGEALQVIAVLEQWLDATHVARAQRRA